MYNVHNAHHANTCEDVWVIIGRGVPSNKNMGLYYVLGTNGRPFKLINNNIALQLAACSLQLWIK